MRHRGVAYVGGDLQIKIFRCNPFAPDSATSKIDKFYRVANWILGKEAQPLSFSRLDRKLF